MRSIDSPGYTCFWCNHEHTHADACGAIVLADDACSCPNLAVAGFSDNDHCHAGRDGECIWGRCPQDADGRANYQTLCVLAARDLKRCPNYEDA